MDAIALIMCTGLPYSDPTRSTPGPAHSVTHSLHASCMDSVFFMAPAILVFMFVMGQCCLHSSSVGSLTYDYDCLYFDRNSWPTGYRVHDSIHCTSAPGVSSFLAVFYLV